MLKKILIVLVLLPILCCLLLIAGIFIYTSSQKEKNILKVNLLYLDTYDNTDYLALKDTEEAKITTNMPFNLDEPVTVETEPTITTTIADISNDKITVTNESTQEIETYTVDEYIDEYPFMNDYNLWADVIDAGKYKVEDAQLDGKSMWKYTLDDASLTNDFIELLKISFEEGFSEGNNKEEGMQVENLQVEFEGKLTYEIFISKDDYKIKEVIVTADKPFTATCEFAGSDVDTMLAYYKSIGKNIQSAQVTVTMENMKLTEEIQELRLKNGKSISKNPVLLFKDAFVNVEDN